MNQLSHSENCSSVIVTASYDSTCPRCAAISKIIHLRRKRVTLGCSVSEQLSAAKLADSLIEKYGLKPVEVIDRLYLREQRIADALAAGKKVGRRNAMDKAEFRNLGKKHRAIVINQDEGVLINDI